MKKLRKMSLIVLIPIILGVGLTVIGGAVQNALISKIGGMILSIGIPVTMFVLVVVGLILMITGKLEDSSNDSYSDNEEVREADNNEVSEGEREFEEIQDINSSYGYESQIKQGEYMMRHTAGVYKNSTPKEKIFGWLFFAFLIIDFALAFVFLTKKIIIGFIVCFCIFAATILICLVVTKARERSSIKAKVDITKDKLLCGEVKACLMSSSTSVGGAHSHSTTRITGVTYRVVVEAEGNTYTGYSHRFYETGDPVVFAVIGKNRISILDNDKFMKETEEILSEEEDSKDIL